MIRWEFYRTPDGRPVVSRELQELLPDVPAKVRLSELMNRIAARCTLPGDVKKLSPSIFEARLSYGGNEYRLHFAYVADGEAIVLALRAVQKRTRQARPADIRASEQRLSSWKRAHGAD